MDKACHYLAFIRLMVLALMLSACASTQVVAAMIKDLKAKGLIGK